MFEIRSRIEAEGYAPDPLADDPTSLVAALAFAGLGSDLGPPLIQGSPRRPDLTLKARESSLATILPRASRPLLLALSAGLLQILDDWTASHEAAQKADDLGEPEFAAYWHAITHRREPDPGNAAYWFRRIGPHAAFAPLAEFASAIVDAKLAETLMPGGSWDPIAFVSFAGAAARRAGSPEEALARRIQRAEMLILLDMNFDAIDRRECGPASAWTAAPPALAQDQDRLGGGRGHPP